MELTKRLNDAFLEELCRRPSVGLTEVRRDGRDDEAVAKVIKTEFERSAKSMGGRSSLLQPYMAQTDHVNHMRTFAAACWVRLITTIANLLLFSIVLIVLNELSFQATMEAMHPVV